MGWECCKFMQLYNSIWNDYQELMNMAEEKQKRAKQIGPGNYCIMNEIGGEKMANMITKRGVSS